MSVGRIWHIRAGMCRKEERHESAADDPENDWRRNGVCRRQRFWSLACRQTKRRIEILREFAQVLILLYGEVEYAAVDMVEIFQKLSEKTCYFRGFFGNMYEGLLRAEDVSLQELWENGITADKTAGMLDREDVMLWREIGMHLGTLDRQTQLQTLHVLQDRLGRSIQDAETEYQSQAKVYRLVGITGGIFTAILLL